MIIVIKIVLNLFVIEPPKIQSICSSTILLRYFNKKNVSLLIVETPPLAP